MKVDICRILFTDKKEGERMKKMHQKLNVSFFGEVDATASYQIIYYCTFAAAAGLLGLLGIM